MLSLRPNRASTRGSSPSEKRPKAGRYDALHQLGRGAHVLRGYGLRGYRPGRLRQRDTPRSSRTVPCRLTRPQPATSAASSLLACSRAASPRAGSALPWARNALSSQAWSVSARQTLLSGLSPNLIALASARFVTGVGLGVVLPIALSIARCGVEGREAPLVVSVVMSGVRSEGRLPRLPSPAPWA